MRDKYTLINAASYKNGLFVQLYSVYGDSGIEYEAVAIGRNPRGKFSISNRFRHKSRTYVNKWREARRADARR